MKSLERAFYIFAIALILSLGHVYAQNPTLTPSYFTVSTAVVTSATTCPAPPAGYLAYCWAGDHPSMVNSSGVITSLVPTASVSGVSAITLCNAAGASCATAQTGAVTINLPTTAKTAVTVTAPAITFSTTGAAVVSAPAATAVTTLN